MSISCLRHRKYFNINVAIFILLITALFSFAQVIPVSAAQKVRSVFDPIDQEEENLTQMQRQARFYRQEALEFQRVGNVEAAMSLYQKAIEIDPGYAVAYNDLGVIYESKGLSDQAEENYLKAVRIDPNYLSAYSNLALLYENKRDLTKAAFYWRKRAESGALDDPWTKKARQRLRDILMVYQAYNPEFSREQEIMDLVRGVNEQMSLLNKDDTTLAQKYFEQAEGAYDREDYATAVKKALDAQQLDPGNKTIDAFIEKTQIRALSK